MQKQEGPYPRQSSAERKEALFHDIIDYFDKGKVCVGVWVCVYVCVGVCGCGCVCVYECVCALCTMQAVGTRTKERSVWVCGWVGGWVCVGRWVGVGVGVCVWVCVCV